jgi:Zn-dependent protease with chaperone function
LTSRTVPRIFRACGLDLMRNASLPRPAGGPTDHGIEMQDDSYPRESHLRKLNSRDRSIQLENTVKRTCCIVRSNLSEKSSRRGAAGSLAMVAVIISALAMAPLGLAERTKVKPGWNVFSAQQDIEIGKETSKQAEQQLAMLNDRKVDSYLNRLGLKLAAKAPGEKYPYQFKGVNDASINAFALPGGFLYINRGTIEAAENEAQLAGVIGHEIGHVALRHGTNQMTKATAMQLPLSVLGGVMGSNSIVGLLTQVGANFGAQSILLKYSRTAENQADIIGTQILYDTNYDPREMANFFMKLEEESKQSGGRSIQFFSSHPNPENRVASVNAEVAKMGGRSASYQDDTAEFREIQRYVRSMPAAPKAQQQATTTGTSRGSTQPPAPPSGRWQDYSNSNLSLRYPDNWKSYGQGDSFTLAPDGGLVADAKGNTSIAYGAIMAMFEPHAGSNGQIDLKSATNELISSLHNSNPDLRISKDPGKIRVGGLPALATTLINASALGGNEIDYLVTVLRPEGMIYFVFVAPEKDFAKYERTFGDMTNSIRFTQR